MNPLSNSCCIAALGSLIATPAFAAQNGPVHLVHGPLAAGTPRVFDVRSQSPNAIVLVFRSNANGVYVPADAALPALAVAPGTLPFARQTDAFGRLRIVLPASPFAPAAGRSAFQVLVRSIDGRWDASEPALVRRNANVPASGWLTENSQPPLPASAATLGATAVQAVDLDRDGDRDLLLAHAHGLALWTDEGATGFVDTGSARLPQLAVTVSCVATADVDRDGDLDVFAGGALDSGNIWPDRLWLNDGTAAFQASASFPQGDGNTACADFGDIDADGDPDLVVAHGADGHGQSTSPCRLLRNDQGLFTADSNFATAAWNDGFAPAPAARFGDVDDDGDLDLFIARSDIQSFHGGPGEQNRLLVNDGTGTFTDETAARFSALFSDNSFDAAFVDIDLDGDLDIAVANYASSVSSATSGDLWINQGGAQGGTAGSFVDDATSPLESTALAHRLRLALVACDVDTDGDPDLLLPVHDLPPGSQPMLLLNQGGAQHGALGRFELAPWFAPGGFIASGAAFFDRDHDGDVELIYAAGGTLTGDPVTANRVLWIESTLP